MISIPSNMFKLCLKMISNELRFHFTIRMMWKTWNVENCISVWKSEHVWCKSRKHKHVHGTKRWTKNPLGTIKQKTLGLRTPGHHETKNRWAVYYLALWNERPLGCVPLGTVQQDHWAACPLTLWNERTLGCVPLDTMKRKTVRLRTPRHQNEMKTND
jgi:hypothetical protein